MSPASAPDDIPDDGGPAARAGMTKDQYSERVWDMAKHLIHPAFLYVVIQVVGLTRLIDHPWFREPGVGRFRELGLFAAGFLGAWAVFYSTLLRDSGLRSLTVTILVPLAALGVVVLFAAFPEPTQMTQTELVWAAIVLLGPAPPAWLITMYRWRAARREAAALLPPEPGS